VKVARVYQYLYYHILFWATRRDRFPEITGFWTMAMAVMLNITMVLFVIRVFAPLQLTLFGFATIAVISLIPQYFCVLHRRRYREVIERYESESARQRRYGHLVASVYAVGSLVGFMASGLLLASHWAK
jgi:ABC-type bacteriocin/lantibiotic exporter with double-glycine peptidase domain